MQRSIKLACHPVYEKDIICITSICDILLQKGEN